MANHTPTSQSNHERIEKMAKEFAPDVLKRLNGIDEWAACVNADLTEIKQALFVTTCDRADAISLELAELRSKRQDDGAAWREQAERRAKASGELATIKQALDEIEAPTMLDVSMELDDAGKKARYGNPETRKAAMTVALAADENYQALRGRERELELEIGRARAILESLDREAKEYGRAVDVLTARLNNLTARVA